MFEGLTGRVFLFGEAKGDYAPKAESKKTLMTRGSGERHKFPPRGMGRISRNRRDFEHFNISMRGLGGVVGFTLPMARADRVRVPYTTYTVHRPWTSREPLIFCS